MTQKITDLTEKEKVLYSEVWNNADFRTENLVRIAFAIVVGTPKLSEYPTKEQMLDAVESSIRQYLLEEEQ